MTKDEIATKAAIEILALVNASPRTPTKEAIAAVVRAAIAIATEDERAAIEYRASLNGLTVTAATL